MAKQQLTPRLNRNEPNIVVDGCHEIWPEGTSISVANNTSFYGSVLFRCGNTSTGVTLTNSRQASVPSGTNLSFSNQMSKTAAGTLSSTTQSHLQCYVEGYDTLRLFNDEFSIIFWVKSSVASNRSISLVNGAATHSYVQQYNIASANTWQLIVLRFPALTTCPGTIDRTNGLGLYVTMPAVVGSSQQTATLNSWISGVFLSGTGEDTTWLTGTTHDFNIAGVMILPGNWTSLTSNTSSYRYSRAGRTFQEELAMSQRYYEKSYASTAAPGTVSDPGSYSYGRSIDTSQVPMHQIFKVQKRATPSMVIYAYDGTAGSISTYNNTGHTGSGVVPNKITDTGYVGIQGGGTLTTPTDYWWLWKADSRF